MISLNEIQKETYCVYAHVNKINSKIYVGQTINGDNPNERWKNGFGYETQPYFYRAIQKYGWDGFDHKIIASNLTKAEANNLEKLLIKKLNTNNKEYGYNLTAGGEGSEGFKHSDVSKSKMSKSQKLRFKESGKKGHPMYGKKHSDETKKKIGKVSKEKWTDENYRKHMSEVHVGKMIGSNNPRARIIAQYTKDNELIRYWGCIQDACNELKIGQSHISQCCMGDRKTAYGFIWRYADEEKAG